MKTCYIFGSLEVKDINLNIDETDLVIAADAGLKNTEKLGIKCDYVVGDFDSLCYTPQGENIIKHPVKKDETDLILAIDIALEKGYDFFKIYGCIGGRFDHSYASVQTASYVLQKGAKCILIGDDIAITMLENDTIIFPTHFKGTISVFAFTDTCTITEKGLLYELNDDILSHNYPLGISNEFTGKDAFISAKKGKACVMWEDLSEGYTIGGLL